MDPRVTSGEDPIGYYNIQVNKSLCVLFFSEEIGFKGNAQTPVLSSIFDLKDFKMKY